MQYGTLKLRAQEYTYVARSGQKKGIAWYLDLLWNSKFKLLIYNISI